ncbi:hypothetical protein OROHE_006814 [Orobanche hederae]
MDEFKAREARNMRKNKLKRKCGGTLPGELGLGTNKTAYIDGAITTIVPSSSSVPVAIDTKYWDLGDADHKCEYCAALFWYNERLRSSYGSTRPKYSTCCLQGKIELPKMKKPPQLLLDLLSWKTPISNHFIKNIRSYNSMFAFTSLGGKIDSNPNMGTSPPIFKLHGQNYHLIGSLMPTEDQAPKFAQLYIYDTENEVANRINSVRSRGNSNGLQANIVQKLKEMLDENNILVQSFRMARDKIQQCSEANIKLKLIGRRDKDGRMYNFPTASEVAALVIGDFDDALGHRDIIVETKTGYLKRINELHVSYLGLQYPLIFPYGEDGYREDISLSITTRLEAAFSRGETNLAAQGLPVVLPSSYTGSPQYMIQNFQDAMTICGWAGYPDLFITLTCNPKWPEISRYLDKVGLNPEDRPDIVCRVFKMKLDGLINDLRKNRVFGRVKAVVYAR